MGALPIIEKYEEKLFVHVEDQVISNKIIIEDQKHDLAKTQAD